MSSEIAHMHYLLISKGYTMNLKMSETEVRAMFEFIANKEVKEHINQLLIMDKKDAILTQFNMILTDEIEKRNQQNKLSDEVIEMFVKKYVNNVQNVEVIRQTQFMYITYYVEDVPYDLIVFNERMS